MPSWTAVAVLHVREGAAVKIEFGAYFRVEHQRHGRIDRAIGISIDHAAPERNIDAFGSLSTLHLEDLDPCQLGVLVVPVVGLHLN